jgi:hypothetical protein
LKTGYFMVKSERKIRKERRKGESKRGKREKIII